MDGNAAPAGVLLVAEMMISVSVQLASRFLVERDVQCAFQHIPRHRFLPARATSTQISTASVLFTGRVDFDPMIRRPDNPDKFSFRFFLATGNARSLWYVLWTPLPTLSL